MRGILIGSSMGVLLFLAGFGEGIGQSFVLGAVCGALAGYTLWRRRNRSR